ncbi:MAG TPA: ATP-binding cassette domain-containing protein [Arachidicoccus sp.]
MLSFKLFEKSYGANTVLKIDDIVLLGGIYWLKGENGSGKSTLIKSLAGLLSFKGEIFFHEISLKRQGVAYRYKINFADAEPLFPEYLTGQEMIDLFIKAKGGATAAADAFITAMNMQSYLQNPLGTYSTGMLKKLSLSLAFIGNPSWILLDEPFIALDVVSLQVLQTHIKKLHEEHKINFLFSSHQHAHLEHLAFVQEVRILDKTIKIV